MNKIIGFAVMCYSVEIFFSVIMCENWKDRLTSALFAGFLTAMFTTGICIAIS